MTAAADTAAAAAICGISDQQLVALNDGGWGDDGGRPGWKREVTAQDGGRMWQRIWALRDWGIWYAKSGGDTTWADGFDKALAWCDERTWGRKPAEPGSATKQEDRFAELAAGGQG